MGKKLIQKIISKQSLISMSLERVFLFTKYDESIVHRLSKTFCIPFNPNWHVDGLLALLIKKKMTFSELLWARRFLTKIEVLHNM